MEFKYRSRIEHTILWGVRGSRISNDTTSRTRQNRPQSRELPMMHQSTIRLHKLNPGQVIFQLSLETYTNIPLDDQYTPLGH